MLLDTLHSFGMNTRQAHVYLAGLEIGKAPASSIARKTGQNRVTCYQTLKEMVRLQFVQEKRKNATAFFVMVSPDILMKRYQEKLQKAKEHLPELMGMMNSLGTKPTMYAYEGIDELKKLCMSMLEDGNEMPDGEPFLSILGTDNINKEMDRWLHDTFLPHRMKYKRRSMVIATACGTSYSSYNKEVHDVVTIDDPLFDTANEIVIYGSNKVAILMYNNDEMSAIKIVSQSLHKAMKNIFHIVWKAYEKR